MNDIKIVGIVLEVSEMSEGGCILKLETTPNPDLKESIIIPCVCSEKLKANTLGYINTKSIIGIQGHFEYNSNNKVIIKVDKITLLKKGDNE